MTTMIGETDGSAAPKGSSHYSLATDSMHFVNVKRLLSVIGRESH